VPTDQEIAASVKPQDIREVAAKIGLSEDELDLYGRTKAKVRPEAAAKAAGRPQGRYVVVTAINPTPLGEGKTVTSIGLGQAMNRLGHRTVTCLRQASLGPALGIKGGAAGGGRAQLIPADEVTLHLTGDMHAVTAANNQCVAMADAHVFHGNELGLADIQLRRVLDVDDRALRQIVQGLGDGNGPLRQTGFDITAASEVMAILALARDLADLRARLGRMVVGFTGDGRPVTAEDLRAAGCMAVLLREAIKPNLVQNLEHDPVFVHAGPFGNIAHGNSSVVADLLAVRLADWVVTEAGFGADLGAEKLFNIKCRVTGLRPRVAVVVATVRALKMHGGVGRVRPGRPLPRELTEENLPALRRGCGNLVKHIENVRLHGVVPVVAINHFPTDGEREIELVREIALDAGAAAAEVSDVHAQGGPGGRALAEAVVKAAEGPDQFRFLYPDDASPEEKMRTICQKVYGADDIELSPLARRQLRRYTELGYGSFPVCMAKTHLSLSADPRLLGRPTGFTVPIREVRASVGAGFLYALCGDMQTMPGLPKESGAMFMDL
jgi:formate--tetrahydrofolate ligase